MVRHDQKTGKELRRLGGLLGMAFLALSAGAMCNTVRAQARLSHREVVEVSRQSCARVFVDSRRGRGSGFFVEPNIVITCDHVIAEIHSYDLNGLRPVYDPNKLKLKWKPFDDIIVETPDGEEIPAECISIPTANEPHPVLYDFAILRLKKGPKRNPTCIPLCQGTTRLIVGDDVYFSGFPLGAPAMLTHKGMLSGLTKDRSLVCIQAPLNRGNSGGALLNSQGEVIGIISNREGGVTQELNRVRKTIAALGGQNIISFTLNGQKVDLLTVDKDTIDILDAYISTGIGYARNISYARNYIQKHALVKPSTTAQP